MVSLKQLLVLTLLVSIYLIQLISTCPTPCKCSNCTTVKCTSKSLTHIPNQIPVNSIELKLDWNLIVNISADNFNGFDSLQLLNLEFNWIENIPDGTFAGLTSLEELNLGHNKISHVSSGTFLGLHSLTRLKLWFNDISTIPDRTFTSTLSLCSLLLQANKIQNISSGTFIGPQSLSNLYLNSNEVKTIPDAAFAGIKNLTILYLSYNSIELISVRAFKGLGNIRILFLDHNKLKAIPSASPLTKLSKISLNDNPFHCDCNFLKVIKNLKNRKILNFYHQKPLCASPFHMRGRDIFNLSKDELNCTSCTRHPCLNQARCIVLNASSYHCSCVVGTTGHHCETVIDNCQPNPCQNGGICNTFVNSYHCICPKEEYGGEHCESEVKQVLCDKYGGITLLLDKRFFNESAYHSISFRNSECKAASNESFVMIFTTLYSCRTSFKQENDVIVIENDVIAAAVRQIAPNGPKEDKIFKASCKYPRNRTTSQVLFEPRTVISSTELGIGSFSLSFTFLKDVSDGKLPNFPVLVGLKDKLYFEIKASSKGRTLGPIIHSCWATSTLDPMDSFRYSFIQNRCPTDQTVKLHSNQSLHVRYFQVEALTIFHPAHSTAFVHCKVFLCIWNSTDGRCHSGCRGNKLPFKHDNRHTTKMSVSPSITLSQKYDLQNGPFVKTVKVKPETENKNSSKNEEIENHKNSSKYETIVYILCILLAVLITCLFGLLIFVKSRLRVAYIGDNYIGHEEFEHIDLDGRNAGIEHEERGFPDSVYGTMNKDRHGFCSRT